MNECKIKINTDVTKTYIDITEKYAPMRTRHVRNKLTPSVYVDGKQVELKPSGRHNNSEVTFTTENDVVEITLTKRYAMEGKGWFWINLLYFFISILGIFDAGEGNRFFTYTYTALLHLNGSNTLEVNINKFVNGQRALEVTGDCEIEERENVFFIRKDLRKRNRLLNFIKLLLWLALIATIILVVIFK